MSSENPLFGPWTGPHGGVPPFDRVEVGHFRPALEAAMAERLAEVEAIAADPEPPTFGNTLAAFEDSGRFLDRVMAVFGVFASTRSTPEFQEVERDFAPKLAALADRITHNAALFARIEPEAVLVFAGVELERVGAVVEGDHALAADGAVELTFAAGVGHHALA